MSSVSDINEQRVFAELVKLVFTQMRAAALGSLLAATCLLIGLFRVVPLSLLIPWYLASFGLAVLRWRMTQYYFASPNSLEHAAYWNRLLIGSCVIGGLLWGFVSVAMLPVAMAYQVLVTLALAGVVAASTAYFAASRTASTLFILMVMPVFGLHMILQGDLTHTLIGLLSLIYSCILILTAHRAYRTLHSALRLKFANVALNEELHIEVNERIQVENLLRQSEEQYRLVTDALPVLIAYIDQNFEFRFNNKAYAEWFKKPLQDITGQSVKDIFGETSFHFFQEHYQKLQSGEEVNYEAMMSFPDEQERYVSVALIPHIQDGVFNGIFSLISDATPRINYLATHDVLTGLANRSLFTARLVRALNDAQRAQTQVALLFVDLDHFKQTNDTLGHDVGDQLLVKVAERLRFSVGKRDLIARLGGDEFIIIIENVNDVRMISFMAEQICQTLAQPYKLNEHDLSITASIGISLFPGDADEVQKLLKYADMAMYRAKELGRNMYVFYQHSAGQITSV